MSKKYKLTDNSKLYFVSFGVTNWIDLFTRNEYKNVSIEKFKALPERKEIRTLWMVFNYESRPFNNSNKGKCVSNIIRNLKRHISEELHKAIINNKTESRKEWMIWMMERAAMKTSNSSKFQLWQPENRFAG